MSGHGNNKTRGGEVMDKNAELRAAAEHYRELSADIADAMDGFCSQTELISLLSRLAGITRPMQSHILATVPADDAVAITVDDRTCGELSCDECNERTASLRQQLADVTAELDYVTEERDRYRDELLEQPPTLEWLRETFGEPDKPGEAETWWGDYLSWTHQWSHCYTGPYNNRRFWKTRAAVLAAVAETKGKP